LSKTGERANLTVKMKIRRLTYNEKHPAVEVLASAFQEYPVMRYILKDSNTNYPGHIEALVDFFCETRLTRDWPLLGVYSGQDLVAVAGINEPIFKPWPEALHDVYNRLGKVIGKDAIQRMEAYERQASKYEPEITHYYLGIIGVLPDHQGKGYAKFLIERLIEMSESDPNSNGISLSTEKKENIPIYKHFGFNVMGDSDIEELHTWCMYRADKNSNTSIKN